MKFIDKLSKAMLMKNKDKKSHDKGIKKRKTILDCAKSYKI